MPRPFVKRNVSAGDGSIRSAELRRHGRRVEASRRELNHGHHLFAREMKTNP